MELGRFVMIIWGSIGMLALMAMRCIRTPQIKFWKIVIINFMLTAAGVVAESDERAEKTGYKIREAQLAKIPYMLVVGDKETEEGTVSVRRRGSMEMTTMTAEEFVKMIVEEINTKAR